MRSGQRPGFPESGGFADLFGEVDRRLRALESANRLTSASIGSGGLRVKDGGKITFLDSAGAVLATLDENGVLVAGAPVLLDGDGLQVGSDVVVDATGLQVIGGFVTPIDVDDGQDDAVDVSLDTNFQAVAQVTLNFASWVETASLFVSAFGRMSVAVNKNLHIQILDDGGSVVAGPVIETVPGGEVAGGATGSVALGASYEEAITGAIDVTLQARVNGGTSTTNSFGLTVLALGFRSL